MKFNKQIFIDNIINFLKEEYNIAPNQANPWQLHNGISHNAVLIISDNYKSSIKLHNEQRKACYFSAEFLVGRAIYNNLLCLGILDEVSNALKECGADINLLEEIEDAALGNGGLGRLAACFLDSAATLNLPLDGYGIRYKFGLFKQDIQNGFQVEDADHWTKYGDPWSKRCEQDKVKIKFADQEVYAVPYDMPIIGYKTNHIGNLRLWQAEPIEEFNFTLFNEQKYDESVKEKNNAENISRVLYPNDDTNEGKVLRLKQQYFFCSASITDIIKKYKEYHGCDLSKLSDFITIQLNDTHPVISIPELIRQLTDIEGMSFESALAVAKEVFNYTNHTIMAEALEKWSADLIIKVVPRIFEIIQEINNTFLNELKEKNYPSEKITKLELIADHTVHMARLAIYISKFTNGVAKIHTDIIKYDALPEWYELYPERFQNKTNGITQRRWLALCNQELTNMMISLIGNDEFLTNLDDLKQLEKYQDDTEVLAQFIKIKQLKKEQLADYILKHDGITINPNTIFDTQIKRLHEYKRQFLNALSILYLYFEIKDGTIKDFFPTTFIFGAKSAPGYRRAKGIIKLINEIAKLVNSDNNTKDILNVVFVKNYNVSYAEKLVAGSDVSEQISTAGTEASGTGNMKFMLNGTVTLGTFDGANVEIVEEAGEENNYIFGAKVEELQEIMKTYNPKEIYENDKKIKRVLNALVDGTLDDNNTGVFKELYTSLLEGASYHRPDNYYLLGDFKSYIEARLRLNNDYKIKEEFYKKCFINMCNAGKFSSDRTINDYAQNIWHIQPVQI
ncbi:glycogen/starch/alpha-glucan phosphorylase [Paludicola sp. MB14-C6]|uniref:glycogen/starch/alpha-glucan phosphorylase n=1 Tax=Paludihabitans sp. MB14-C6 TaxID=3070656 RepID=UPI0027DB7706|nr:glycogen/starch/alpha-glucan phosphorylase [Paludicola sp. MB14-C6]WMJ23227.1 glycogen/starch/alpha-glucan phosphorylase [Paludicola sp. MB14-C6]